MWEDKSPVPWLPLSSDRHGAHGLYVHRNSRSACDLASTDNLVGYCCFDHLAFCQVVEGLVDGFPVGTVGAYRVDADVGVLLWASAGRVGSPVAGLGTAALAVWETGTAVAVEVAVLVVGSAVIDPPVGT